jgi:hypothetical protein
VDEEAPLFTESIQGDVSSLMPLKRCHAEQSGSFKGFERHERLSHIAVFGFRRKCLGSGPGEKTV